MYSQFRYKETHNCSYVLAVEKICKFEKYRSTVLYVR